MARTTWPLPVSRSAPMNSSTAWVWYLRSSRRAEAYSGERRAISIRVAADSSSTLIPRLAHFFTAANVAGPKEREAATTSRFAS